MTDDEALCAAVAGTEGLGIAASFRHVFEAGMRQAMVVQRSLSQDEALGRASATLRNVEGSAGRHFFNSGVTWAHAQSIETPGTPSDLDARAATYRRNVNFETQHLDMDQVWAEGVLHGRATPRRSALPRSNPMEGLLNTLIGSSPPQVTEIPIEHTAAPNRAVQAQAIEGEGEDALFARALATWPLRHFPNHGDLLNDIARHVFDFARSCTELPWQPLDQAPRIEGRLYVLRCVRASTQLRNSGDDIQMARFSAMESEAGGRPDRWEFVANAGFIDRSTLRSWQWLDMSRIGIRPLAPPEPSAPADPVPAAPRGVRRMAI